MGCHEGLYTHIAILTLYIRLGYILKWRVGKLMDTFTPFLSIMHRLISFVNPGTTPLEVGTTQWQI